MSPSTPPRKEASARPGGWAAVEGTGAVPVASAPVKASATTKPPRAVPRSASRPVPRRTGAATSGVRIPKARASSRPGGPSGSGRTTQPRNRIEPAAARGSWVTAMGWRLVVLVGVVVLAAAVVLPSLRSYFRQQEELAALRAEATAAQQQVEDLAAETARWEDPAFVVAQARERLAYVFPGETPYRVIDPETVEGAADGATTTTGAVAEEESGTWYTRLWESVDQSGD